MARFISQSLRMAAFAAAAAVSAGEELMMGISYGPVPLKGVVGASELPQDDWMCGEAVAMWGRAGRADLKHIKMLGANAVRLYGNSPDNDHTTFLDEAWREGLSVLPGLSDFPYYQMQPGSCQQTGFNCFTQVKPLYLKNLMKGFMLVNKTYHPSLRVMNILNEPDLKMPSDATNGDSEGPKKMARSIISAFDAMLEAEKEAGITGPLINFTATFSYAICPVCEQFNSAPGLGQVAALQDAMYNPEKYGYTPVNNITAAYEARFVHSFNTQNPATDVQTQFLDGYNTMCPNTPVYIGEYHRVGANQTEDLTTILDIAARNPLFQGISFFQFQVAYWKTGSETAFGMMGLGDYLIDTMQYFGKEYSIWCLQPVNEPATGKLMANSVARVYGGSPVDTTTLCVANPYGAALRESGFVSIAEQNSVPQMAGFVDHVLLHMGATVTDSQGLNTFAARFAGAAGSSFAPMMSELGSRPAWASFDTQAKCIASREATPAVVGSAIGWACTQANVPNCSHIPEPCSHSTYTIADYIFSRYYEGLPGSKDPLANCNFEGAAIFASSALYSQWSGASECVAGSDFVFPSTTTEVSSGTGASTTEPTAVATTTDSAASETSTLEPATSTSQALAGESTTTLRGSSSTTSQQQAAGTSTTQGSSVSTSAEGNTLPTTPELEPAPSSAVQSGLAMPLFAHLALVLAARAFVGA